MRTGDDIHTVDIDLDRVLWDAEYRRRVIDSLKRRHKTPTADLPPPGRDRAPTMPPTDEHEADPTAGN